MVMRFFNCRHPCESGTSTLRAAVPLPSRAQHPTMIAPEAREAHCGAELVAPATINDNTNSNAATNGLSLHTRRHLFAAKSPSRRSRTRSWTQHGTPPKEAAAHQAMHKKMQIRAMWSRRARALTE